MNEWVARLDGVVTERAALERAFEANLEEWSRLAFRVAYSVLRHREDAEDIAQDVLTRAHGRLGQLRDAERLRAWLVRMTWRLAINRRTADQRRAIRDQAVPVIEYPPSSEELALSAERSAQVWTMIDRLSERLRVVVVLSAMEGHDVATVASMLGIPEGTVKRRLFDARQQLRGWLE